MKYIKIFNCWINGMYPSELLPISFLNYYEEENGCPFEGSVQELWIKMNKIVAAGTIAAGISHAKQKRFLTATPTKGRNYVFKTTKINGPYDFSIPIFFFLSNKFSPLEKLIYGYVENGFTPSITVEKIKQDLGIKGNRYFNKDLKHLIDEGIIILVDGKYYRANALKEENFSNISNWKKRYRKKKFNLMKFLKNLWKNWK